MQWAALQERPHVCRKARWSTVGGRPWRKGSLIHPQATVTGRTLKGSLGQGLRKDETHEERSVC